MGNRKKLEENAASVDEENHGSDEDAGGDNKPDEVERKDKDKEEEKDEVKDKEKGEVEDEDLPQNLKWKVAVTNSQLSKIIIKIKNDYDLIATPLGFSWRKLVINDMEMMPTAFDQKQTELCILYSLKGLFRFQLNLLETDLGKIDFEPSFEYMQKVLNTMDSPTNLDGFLWQLRKRKISDKVEFASVNSDLRKTHVKRFQIEYEFIDPKEADGLDSIKEAIDTAGGVLLSVVQYIRGSDKMPLIDDNGEKQVKWITVYEKGEGTKRKAERKRLCHAVFCHSWKTEGKEVKFQYLNSYGNYNADQGHDVCKMEDILQVFTPQLSFNISGFPPDKSSPKRKRRSKRR